MDDAKHASVLIVEESRLASTLLAKSLGSTLEIHTVRTGAAAWERLLLDPSIDALICDYAVPGLSDDSLIGRLRSSSSERLQSLPLIVLSNEDDPRRALEVIARGASAFVDKRRALTDLAPAVAGCLPGKISTAGLKPAEEAAGRGHSVCRLRMRWAALDRGTRYDGGADTDAVNLQLKYTMEIQLRSSDTWTADADGAGGLLRLGCDLENVLRPLLRLIGRLKEAAGKLDRALAIAVRLEPAEAEEQDGELTIPQDFPELPGADEVSIVLPNGMFRLRLDSIQP